MQDIIFRRALDLISAADTLTLPMNVRGITEHFGYYVEYYSYSLELIKGLGLLNKAARYPAVCAKHCGEYYIFLSDDLNADQERYSIAHELGHIALGHIEPDAPKLEKEEEERQADRFALLLLAPPPLLKSYSVASAECIQRYTGLSLNDSRLAFQALEDYRLYQNEAARQESITRRATLAHAPPAKLSFFPFLKKVRSPLSIRARGFGK